MIRGGQLSAGSGKGQSHRKTEVGRERGCPIKRRAAGLCVRGRHGVLGAQIVGSLMGRLEADRP